MSQHSEIELQYLVQQLQRSVKKIFEAQREIASQEIYNHEPRKKRSRSGALLDALSNPQYRLEQSGGGLILEATVPIYIRFLDMRKHGNHKIYNRQVWGILYKDTLLRIKAEYRDWLTDHFPEMLRTLLPNQK